MLSRFQRFLSILILPFLQVLLGQQLVFIQNAENFTVFFPGQIALEKIKIKGLQTESSFLGRGNSNLAMHSPPTLKSKQ